MKKKKITAILVINLFLTLGGFLTFINHIDTPGDWRFYASLIGFVTFLVFSILIFIKLKKSTANPEY